MFDHSARREDSKHCKVLYPPDLWDIHEKFVFDLRYHMAAVVEICWGANVRERMLARLQNDLRILPLWGRYQGVTLYLELAKDRKSVRRFIIFANHPQFFMFMKRTNVRAQAFRTEQEGRQDLLLEVAASLGNITIDAGFYTLGPLLLRPFRPARKIREQRDAWKGQAYVELKSVFPEAVLFSSVGRTLGISQKDDIEFPDSKLPAIENILKTPNILAGEDLQNNNALKEARLQKFALLWKDLEDLDVTLMPGTSFNLADKNQCQQMITRLESCGEKLYHWEELPESLAEFIRAQDGLRIDRRPIDSREGAETTYRLLHCKGGPECLSIVGLAFSILIVYAWTVRRTPRGTVADLIVLRAQPKKNIVSRVCSACGGRVLDDPFAYYAENNLVTMSLEVLRLAAGLLTALEVMFFSILWKDVKITFVLLPRH